MNRRQMLALGGASLAAGSFSHALPRSLRRLGGGATPGKKLLVIELTGGNDALSTLLPVGDSQYGDPALRPTLWIPANEGLDAGNGFAKLSPHLWRTQEMLLGDGDVALIHRVGNENPNLSHFAGILGVNTALPGDETARRGMLNRWGEAVYADDPVSMVSVTKHPLGLFRGPKAPAHLKSIKEFLFGEDAASLKLRGSGDAGLIASYRDAHLLKGPRAEYLASMGDVTFDTLKIVENLPPVEPNVEAYPQTPAEIEAQGLPAGNNTRDVLAQLRDAVRLLKDTDVHVAGARIFGWDSHAGQGGVVGGHANNVRLLDHCLHAVKLDTQGGLWDDLVVLVLSEFGRTTRENGSQGTDHGVGGLWIVAGGGVRGGVYNCDSASWPSGETLLSRDNKYVAHATDFRAIYAEVLDRHFGSTPSLLDTAMPGWSGLAGSSAQYDYVGFL